MFDVDGDKALVTNDELLIKVARRNMEGVVPLYYEMAKAGNQLINRRNVYNGMIHAYTGGNIGLVSNNITKIWNSDDVNMDIIKLLCMENNFVIDYAKTMYKPVRPSKISGIISQHTNKKVPHFFIHAKDKRKKEVEPINNSSINKLNKIIPSNRLYFKMTDLGKFDYKNLLSDKEFAPNKDSQNIIDEYTRLDLHKHFMVNRYDGKHDNIVYVYQSIKDSILEIHDNVDFVTNTLIDFLYNHKKTNYKTTLWECFGDTMLENIQNNIKPKELVYCKNCGIPMKNATNRTIYCVDCAIEIRRERTRDRVKKHRM
jgi:hypothetical protein